MGELGYIGTAGYLFVVFGAPGITFYVLMRHLKLEIAKIDRRSAERAIGEVGYRNPDIFTKRDRLDDALIRYGLLLPR